jgi:Tfp pilus assembly protein PilF
LLKSGDAAKAEKIFKEDLQENPNNHWALYGLYQSLIKQKKNAAAVIVKKQFDKAFEGGDITAGNIIF